MQLQQPPCIHQVPNCCPCCCCCAVYLTIPSLSLSCRWTEVVSTTPFMLLCCCCCCFQQLSSMLPLQQQQRQSLHCGCTSSPDPTPASADFWHQVSFCQFSFVTHALDKRVRRAEQGKLEGSALYAQQQAANAAAAATCIQAVWRGRQARRSTASLRVVLQQQRQRDRAATAIQVCHVGDKLCFS